MGSDIISKGDDMKYILTEPPIASFGDHNHQVLIWKDRVGGDKGGDEPIIKSCQKFSGVTTSGEY